MLQPDTVRPQAGEGHPRRTRIRLPNGAERVDETDAEGRLVAQHLPDGTVRRYGYAGDGSLETLDDGHGRITRFAADASGLTATLDSPLGPVETTILRDAEGRPAGLVQRIGALEWRLHLHRDAEGREIGWDYPGAAARLRLHEDGRLAAGARVYLRLQRGPDGSRVRLANGARVHERLTAAPGLPRLAAWHLKAGETRIDLAYTHDEVGRIVAAGAERYAYDTAGRLTAVEGGGHPTRIDHDGAGRLRRIEGDRAARTIRHDQGPMARRVGRRVLSCDALGQRTRANGPEGVTRYRYDGLGQMDGADLPDGRTIRYLYDGFGRLVGRVAGEDVEVYLVDPDGRRLATFDAQGRCRHSYIWLGLSCVAAIDGPIGRRLARSFHRAHGGRPVACVDAEGRAEIVPPGDPFGADLPVSRHAPGFGGLFGDPETGLLSAGARWLDPQTAQFTAPDSWFGVDPNAAATRRLGRVLRALPGGTGRLLDPASAYDWCALDPINAVDMNGHNWLGLIFTSISALLWQMQLTSVSLQMQAINIVLEVVMAVVYVFLSMFKHGWADDGARDFYWHWSIFNLGAPTASYKLMVPLALWLNGFMKFQPERAWTLGNVVWHAGSSRRDLERDAARDLVIAPDASAFLAAQPFAGGFGYLVANPQTAATGTVAAGAVPGTPPLDRITGVTLGSGAAASDVYGWGDWVRLVLSATDTDTLTAIRTVVGSSIDMPPVPAAFDTNAVDVTRLDQPWVQISGGGRTIARPIVFVSGEVLHIGQQLPETIPAAGLNLREFIADARRDARSNLAFPGAQWIVRAGPGATVEGHAVGDALRIERGEARLGRRIAGLDAPHDIILDEALPDGSRAVLATMQLAPTGAVESGQSVETDADGARTRLSAGRLTALRPGDGVEIGGTGTTTAEVRIVGTVLEAVTIAALPAALVGPAIAADRVRAAGGSPVAGIIADGGQAVDTADGDETRVAVDQIVRIVQPGGADLAGMVATIDTDAHRIRLTRTTGLADGTAVTLIGQQDDRTIAAEPAVAPGERLLLRPDRPGRLAADNILRIRREDEEGGDELRVVQGAPVVIADLTEAVAGATGTGLSVQRLVDGDRRLTGASAVSTHVRLDFGAPPPFAAGEHLLITDTPVTPDIVPESVIAQVGSIDGDAVVLERGVELPDTGTVDVIRVVPTGPAVSGGSLGEGLVLPPAFMDDEPLTRRRALEYHEMRHVFQEALWGPFFISMPVPWLIHLGASFRDSSHAVSSWTRHFSLGGIDSGIAKLWELGQRAANENQPELTEIGGSLQADRRTVNADADATEQELEQFAEGHRIEIGEGSTREFNVVDRLDLGARSITLRFPASEDRFAVGADLRLSVSLFEQIRRKVQLYFSFNLEQLWADHIPTAWGRALSGFLNRDSWFPLLGLYPLSFIWSGRDDSRSPFEQDAAFYSGDLYTSIPLAEPHEVFTGQFTRIYGFIQARAATVAARATPTRLLTITLPAGANIADVGGAADDGGGRVRLRESHLLRMHPRVENMVAGLFVASAPGTYELELPGKLREDVVFAGAMPTAFTERDRVVVAEVRLDPAPGALFECEHVVYRIQAGDPSATYALRFPDGPAGVGLVDAMAYTAPAVAAPTTQRLELTATYPETHPVFSGPGQDGPARLSAAQRTNRAGRFDLTVQPIAAPSVGPVAAGSATDFETPITPREAEVTSALPAGASTPARVVIRPGRPARLTFVAPDAVDAAVDVTVALRFGRDPTLVPGAPQREHVVTVRVDPA